MIDLIYKTLLTIINKENQGYVSPTEFNVLAYQVQMEIFRDYFEDENRDKTKKNRGLVNDGYANLDFNVRQRLSNFTSFATVQVQSGQADLPKDLYFIEDNGITTSRGIVVEEVERSSVGFVTPSLSAPSELFPVYYNMSGKIRITPSTVSEVEIFYIRVPKKPMWTYFTLPQGGELFDPSNPSYQDFELHESEFPNIVNRLLTYFGINLREQEVIQIAQQLKADMNFKDNN